MNTRDPGDTEASVWPMCTSDACDCGRKPCPTPAACLMPEAGPSRLGMRVVHWIAPVLFVVVVACLAAGVFDDPAVTPAAPSSTASLDTTGADGASTHGEKQ